MIITKRKLIEETIKEGKKYIPESRLNDWEEYVKSVYNNIDVRQEYKIYQDAFSALFETLDAIEFGVTYTKEQARNWVDFFAGGMGNLKHGFITYAVEAFCEKYELLPENNEREM